MTESRKLSSPKSPITTISTLAVVVVVLVLLVLVVTFAVHRRLDLELRPETSEPDGVVDLAESVVVEVLPDGRLLVNQQTMAVEALLAHLAPILRRTPGKQVIVRPDPASRSRARRPRPRLHSGAVRRRC